ncbi:MAG: hypothetical protein K2W85_14590 [Phycisphaerales bacterium]|nr:hypothetical protein [Phycisphaerales bacterium]
MAKSAKPSSKSKSASKPAPKPAKKPAPKPAKPQASAPKKGPVKPAAKSVPSKPAATKPVSSKPAPSKSEKSVKPAPAPSVKGKPAAAPIKPGKPEAAKSTKPEAAKVIEPKPSAVPAPAAASAGGGTGTDADKKPKGITIVSNKPVRKPKPKKLEMPVSEPLLKPGSKWKPLITSGPKAPPSSGIPGEIIPSEFKLDPKAKLPKKELDKYREILLRKRAELVGDVANMEGEALLGNSGSLSNLPQHMAEQGSDAFDQALSLDLAQVDRTLIKEIDEALKRIEDGTYGVCPATGKRISAERLAEIPWAKYSIEAAREMENRRFTVSSSSAGEGPKGGSDED